ncbi:succinate dehydrogenase subunit C [Thermobifida fusca YX]|uniref:Succinate dehydrogenase subunit C n=1 Tax=Thermobifida fusca (strain YX) TaxID=269800 RepID=Q47M36_THEFY|nr:MULTISPECIES: succinate dehydrogenase cytochrome b subunit [Thermobifida]AAZ56486.1 succinate dehydrogenase subunit C [Thermobifida fusca YX]MBO2530444.1 succinate dehydrogenase [Thermobifida sp.]MDD6790648.1 succinate dehydrogenase cytochrome b subunit [Thermobifida fusca]PPS93878.1 succinate dehydrogenase [Thermobifida fusca]PZN61217.1 MAG: succinate dehydrogenase [Thermobifida fusca]
MANSTLTKQRSAAFRSTVALKAAMAITGAILVLFLIAHMYGNLMIFGGQEAFDEYSHHLRVLGAPMLPTNGFLWIMRVVLLASVLIHMYAAFTLWNRARQATAGKGSRRYHSKKNRTGVQRTYASFTMRWGGVVIALFVLYHLLHLTTNHIAPGGASDSPYERVVNGFQIWWVVLTYFISMLAVGFHLRHGLWSAVQTLGKNKARRQRAINAVATAVAVAITVGFLIPPFSVLFGLVG